VNPRAILIRQAFDRHASSYDARFSSAPLGESIRSDFCEVADTVFASAEDLLDLGAGTGEDAVHFATLGKHVTAVDVSPQMIAALRSKADAARVSDRIEAVVGEMSEYRPSGQIFDGMLSNFGALNCVADLSWLGPLCAASLKPGSPVVLVTMGLIYPLETAVFLMRGQVRLALRRLKNPCEVRIEGVTVHVHYHSIRTIRRALGPHFRLEQIRGLRALLPVPGWEHLDASRLFRVLAPVDRLICRLRPTATLADHFISVWRYVP
jgi:2-polyprenyl-3-methyl-5-hydroxy-6-metoxy-1,4-benzoquinol methylase